MKRLLKYFSIFVCLVVALSSCDEYVSDSETRKNEYTIWYEVTYSTTYDFHNIAYFSFTSFYDIEKDKYTNQPSQLLRQIEGTKEYIKATRVPKGAHVELSTYVDVEEALPNTKVRISISMAKGKEWDSEEVASVEGGCPLKGNPLTISYDVPNE